MPDPGSVSKIRVFLSHSTSDKEVVRGLYHRLKDDGFEPWMDDEDLIAGQNWRLETRNAVRKSDVVLICLSTISVKTAGYVHKEMSMALDLAENQPEGAIFIIPLRLDDCEVPERLADLDLLYVDLFRDNGYEKLKKALSLKAGAMNKDSLPASAAANVSVSAPVVVSEQTDAVEPVVGTKAPDAAPGEPEKNSNEKEDAKKDGWITKYQTIILAVIAGLVTLTGAYWQFVRKPSPPDPPAIQYSGRVLDSVTQKTISGALVIAETDGVPLQQRTDANGIFYFELKTSKDAARIRVSADGYASSDRIVSLTRTGVEEFSLSPIVKDDAAPANTAALSPSPPISTSSSPAVRNGGPASPTPQGRPR